MGLGWVMGLGWAMGPIYGADLWGGALGLTETPSKAEELRARYISAVIYGAGLWGWQWGSAMG